MFKKLKLTSKLLLYILSPVIQIFGITILVVSIQLVNLETENSSTVMEYMSQDYSNIVKLELEELIIVPRIVQQIFSGFEQKLEQDRRSQYLVMLKQLLEQNPNILAIWTCWEQNGIDQLDQNYQNTEWYDNTGRFVPYVVRDNNNNVKIEQLVDYDTPGQGDYYLLQKNSGKEVITDPYPYSVNSKDILMSSLVVPIFNSKNRIVGVAGIDIQLDNLQQIISAIKPYETGISQLFTNSGIIQQHFDPSRIGKQGRNTEQSMVGKYLFDFFNAIKNGYVFDYTIYSEDFKSDLYVHSIPITIGNTTTPWSLQIGIPKNKVMEKQNNLLYFLIILQQVSVSVLFLIVFMVQKTITKPIIRLTTSITKMGNNDLTNTSDEIKDQEKYTKLLDEIGKIYNNISALRSTLVTIFSNFKQSIQSLTTNQIKLSNGSNQQLQQFDILVKKTEAVEDHTQNMSQQIEEATSGVEEVQQSAQDVSELPSILIKIEASSEA